MKKKIVPLVIVLLLAVAGGWFWLQQHDSGQSPNQLTLYGNVDIREAQLAFNASEHVDTILVQEGDHVKRGQLLATLHTPLLQARLDEAQALVEAAYQNLARLNAGSRPEEIDKGRALLEAAQARAKGAHDTARRVQKLLPKKLASEQEVENASSVSDIADADVKAAQKSLALLLAGPRVEVIAEAKAQLSARKAGLALAQQHLADASLLAPENGIIRNRILEPGDMANPQKPVLTLAFTNPVWVRAYLPETYLGKVKPGMKAQILSDSYPGKRYDGWVGYISPTAEFTPKNVQTPELRTRLVYSVRIYACNPQEELRLGMPATVIIPLHQTPQPMGKKRQCPAGQRLPH